jgi:hypothetical protein
MEYILTSSIDQNIMEITLSGKGAKKDTVEIFLKVVDLVMSLKPKGVLIDLQQMQNRLDLLETYQLVHTYPQEVSHIKTAIVDLKENKEFSDFYETVSENSGYITRYFTDGETARAWLKS